MERITHDEAIRFIGYLRRKEDVFIETQMIPQRTFFNRCRIDMSNTARHMLEVMKTSESATAAYGALAHETAKLNSLWKLLPELSYIFAEDLSDYLRTHGIASGDAKDVRASQCAGGDGLPADFLRWYHAGPNLASRNIFCEYFPTEYLHFLHDEGVTQDGAFDVLPVPTNGVRNYYRLERNIVREADRERLTIGFDSRINNITAEQLVPLAKFICETYGQQRVNITDYSTDVMLVVRKGEDGVS